MKNINELLRGVTNIDTEGFYTRTKDGGRVPAAAAAKLGTLDNGEAKFYSFDLKNGAVKCTTLNVKMRHVISPVALAEAVAKVWYHYEYIKMEKAYEAYTDVDAVEEELRPVLTVVQRRMASVRFFLEEYTQDKIKDIPNFIETWVRAMRRDKPKDYPSEFSKAMGGVLDAIKNAPANGDTPTYFKDLREAIKQTNALLFSAYSDGDTVVTDNYVYNCNEKLATDVYRVAYKRRELDGHGFVKKKMANSGGLFAEIVLACIEHLQVKPSKEAAPEEKEAAK